MWCCNGVKLCSLILGNRVLWRILEPKREAVTRVGEN
jgi:hypothetical protein